MKIEVQHIFEGVRIIFSGNDGSKFTPVITRQQAVTLADRILHQEIKEQERLYRQRGSG